MNEAVNGRIITKAAVVWFFLIGVLWYWNWEQIEQSITEIARAEAYASAGKDILYHKWSGIQGGVYIHPTKSTPPNPYLSFLQEQTIVTDAGEKFTLINPAYMVRQVNELAQSTTGRRARLTSLRPIRPKNRPDPWETQALKKLEAGENSDEVYSLQTMNGHNYLRVMRPMYAVESCIKCHNRAGYDLKVNDLRGGISVSVDFVPYSEAIRLQRIRISIAYLLVWGAGLWGLCLWHKKNSHFVSELRTRENQLRVLINAAPDTICMKDGAGRWLESNDENSKLFSLNETNYRGKTDLELAEKATPKLSDAFLHCARSDERAWQARKILQSEEIIETLDGQKKIYDIIKAPIFNQDGSRQGLIVLGRDITERKKHDAERQMLISAIEQTAEAVVVTDTKGIIQYVNPACEKNTGYNRTELMGAKPSIFKSDTQDVSYYSLLWKTITAGDVWSGRIVNRKKNGELFTEEMTISPVRNDEGEIINFVAVKQNISQQIKLEQEKDRIEQQFQQAQKMESVGRLAGGIAHDLNNLLTPMLGYSEFLLHSEQNIAPRWKEPVEQILLAGRKAREIVHRLLAFSRDQSLELKNVNINKILCDFEKLLRCTIRENIFIDILLDPAYPEIIADTSRLEQIIMNIAVNAQDSMIEGGTLLIETRIIDMEKTTEHEAVSGTCSGKYVAMALSDTGSGMNKEVLNSIFEPFFTTKEKFKGTGLGLSTVYGLVKQLQGEISVFSTLGEGTDFLLYFPLADTIHPESIKTENSNMPNPAQRKNAKIMVVEDDEQVRSLTVMILKSRGFNVLSAENGHEALALFKQQPDSIDLLISDIIMPKMNGKELYEILLTSDPELRVVFLSGYAENILAEDDLLNDNVGFLQKPFAITDLFDIVDEALG